VRPATFFGFWLLVIRFAPALGHGCVSAAAVRHRHLLLLLLLLALTAAAAAAAAALTAF
jgi:hypothetical protein